ncbi:hypothetical protein Sjap_013043 [Stephania japonica]|uniref:Uncharacterized protein n=1 Tax=Stephania japonica TaxID=461633 RepID=A0AAP0IX80_9MAGN
MKMQQQRFLNSSSSSPSSIEGFCGRAIFSDPCAGCGNKKRIDDSRPLSASLTLTPTTPPPASIQRSFSDVTPAPARELLCIPTLLMSAPDDKSHQNSVAGDEHNDGSAPLELCNDDNEINRVGEKNAERESELGGDTVTFLHKCP